MSVNMSPTSSTPKGDVLWLTISEKRMSKLLFSSEDAAFIEKQPYTKDLQPSQCPLAAIDRIFLG